MFDRDRKGFAVGARQRGSLTTSSSSFPLNYANLCAQKPREFRLEWCYESGDSNLSKLCVWEIVAPSGFVSLGSVATLNNQLPDIESIRCVREVIFQNGMNSNGLRLPVV